MGPAGTGGTVNPPGWDQMTPQERERFQRDIDGAKSSEECRILMQRQQDAMTQRARERGQPPPGSPGRDLCAPAPRGGATRLGAARRRLAL